MKLSGRGVHSENTKYPCVSGTMKLSGRGVHSENTKYPCVSGTMNCLEGVYTVRIRSIPVSAEQ